MKSVTYGSRLWAFGVLLTTTALWAQPDPGPTVVTQHETIPNPVFGSAQRVVAVCRGVATPCEWASASTWTTGAVPAQGTRVIVDGNVRISTTAAVALEVGVYPSGRLSFNPAIDTALSTGSLLVFAGGQLEIGTETAPVDATRQAEVVFRDLPFDDDPGEHLRGLLAIDGAVQMHGRAVAAPFLRLALEPQAGGTSLQVSSSALAAGWQVGDRLVVPVSAQCPKQSVTQCPVQTEDHTVASISGDGLTVGLNTALSFDHPGARNLAGTLEILPHVLNETRNVVLRSENPAGIRGHVLFHGRADVDVRYSLFSHLGRTNIEDLGPTNQKGRYPLHAHHLIGPQTPQLNGHQFTLVGNVIDFGVGNQAQDRKWGLTVHGSHFGLIERNIVDQASGAGLVTEDASETGNVFRKNFVVRIVGGNGSRTEDRDPGDGSKLGRAGVGFWFNGGGGNTYEDNIAADVEECTYCYGFKFDNVFNGDVMIPSTQGADPHDGGGVLTDSYTLGLTNFRRNEAYAVPNGLTIWWVCTEFETPRETCTSRVEDFRVWHHHRWGYFAYETSKLTLERFVHRGDVDILANPFEFPTGLYLVDYLQRQTTIKSADIQGAASAIVAPVNRDVRGASGRDIGRTVIEDSFLGAGTGIDFYAPSSTNGAGNLSPQTTILRHVTFAHPATRPGPNLWFGSSGAPGATSENLELRNDVWIYDYNSPPGVDGPDLYLIPAYQDPSRCEPDLGDCANEITESYPEIEGAFVYPFFGTIFADGFETGDTSAWTMLVP